MRRLLKKFSERLDTRRYMDRLRREIRRYGWSSVATWDDACVQYWEYTVGFDESLDHPEFVVAGLPPYAGRAVFGPLHAAIRYGSLNVADGVRWGLHGTDLYVLRKLHPSRLTADWLAIALHRRAERGLASEDLRAFQVVFPGQNGVLPWEPGYDEVLRMRTPELWRPPQHRGCGERRPMTPDARHSAGR